MKIRDRIKELRRVKASELIPNPKNWRTHPIAQQDALKGILAEVGFAGAVLARELDDGTLMLIDGHMRAEATTDQEIPVLILDVDEAESDKLLATFDPIAAMAESDAHALDALLRNVDTGSEALQKMLAELAEGAGLYQDKEVLEDEVPEPPADPITKPGDLWILGEHRVLCGDSTKAEDVGRLMAGARAGIVLTDPPFGNNLGYGRGQLGERRILNDENTLTMCKVFEPLNAVLNENSHCLVWVQWRTFPELKEAFSKYKLRTVIIWDKKQAGLSGGGLAEQYEMLCVFIKGNAIQNAYSGNVWSCAREHGTRSEIEHPHKKPIEVLTRALNLCSKNDDLILDLFLGSGSTLIAAEQLGRKCYGMELSPAYCDVIVQRWEKLTGKTATLEVKNG